MNHEKAAITYAVGEHQIFNKMAVPSHQFADQECTQQIDDKNMQQSLQQRTVSDLNVAHGRVRNSENTPSLLLPVSYSSR
ncbi:hypothetical protein [Undibacterium luofuense]|uniref:hypothetical protein n=1 Tax=Undibacterium luofuense TaxID=2828733 RepID=UPI0030EBE7B5